MRYIEGTLGSFEVIVRDKSLYRYLMVLAVFKIFDDLLSTFGTRVKDFFTDRYLAVPMHCFKHHHL